MSIKGKAYIAGAYEHPTRLAPDKSTPQLHAECAKGALEDAGLTKDDIDGYFCAGDAPGFGALSMADYMGLKLRHMDSTETGGSSYIVHVGHAAEAIAAGQLLRGADHLAGRPFGASRSGGAVSAWLRPRRISKAPTAARPPTSMACAPPATCTSSARRRSSWPGSRSPRSTHAQYNPHAMLQDVVTVEEVLNSPIISTPLHRLDCCVISDGGGALIVTSPEIAQEP